MHRRSFIALAAVAAGVSGMTTVNTRSGDRLVVVVESPIKKQYLDSIAEEFKRAGIDAVIVNLNAKVMTVGVDSTFRIAGRSAPCRVLCDGIERDDVIWADSASGLVCSRNKQTMELRVDQFDSVRFAPL